MSTLRYSPVNWLIVDWGYNGVPFNSCGLPSPPSCPEESETETAACSSTPIREAINTYDWARWLPEITVGIEEPDEEIAANYAREAAIMFAKQARVLQRQITVQLEDGVCVYPVDPYDNERIIGVIGIAVDDEQACCCDTDCGMLMPNGINFSFDAARNEVHVEGRLSSSCSTPSTMRILVWAAPTEAACTHDVFLYDHYRRAITLEARRAYILALHFRDKDLLRVLPSRAEFEREVRLAKVHSMQAHSWSQKRPGSGMWSSSCSSMTANCLWPR